jgi:hypothetical protein
MTMNKYWQKIYAEYAQLKQFYLEADAYESNSNGDTLYAAHMALYEIRKRIAYDKWYDKEMAN